MAAHASITARLRWLLGRYCRDEDARTDRRPGVFSFTSLIRAARSEFLREPEQEGAALAELRRADADAGAVADLVAVVEQVDGIEADLRALAEADRDLLHQRGVDDGVVGQRQVVGRDDCGAKSAAEQHVGRDLGR